MDVDRERGGAAGVGAASPGDGVTIDAKGAMGVQVGSDNTQINYHYHGTWTDGVAPPPLVDAYGEVESPYRGLGSFGERDAAFFFGREQVTAELLERMARCADSAGLLVVSGVSGAGKTSLLRAGVIPRFRGAGLTPVVGSASWPCLVLTPGREPLDELAVRVGSLAGADAGSVRHMLDEDPARFALTAAQAALARPGQSLVNAAEQDQGRSRRLLLIVDQFEQTFTQCSDEVQRRGFVEALHAAATDPRSHGTPPALVVLVVRADFEARCADYPELTDAVQSRYLVTAMTEQQLRLAISEPPKKSGSRVDADLVETLLRDIQTRRSGPAGSVAGTGVLPLLSHALDQAWRHRASDVLVLADYERTGGIERAVADSAQRTYDRLTPSQQNLARQVFTRLTATTSDGADTADRAERSELTRNRTEADARDIDAVLEAFAAERLLTIAADTVEISHEVLLTAWPLLRDTWLAETHEDRAVLSRLRGTAAEWASHAHDQAYLYSGNVLDSAIKTSRRIADNTTRHPPLGVREREFLRASIRAQRRRVRRGRAFAAFLVLVVVLSTATVIVYRANQNTTRERNAALSREVIMQFESAIYGERSGEKAHSLVAPEANIGSASEIQADIDAIPDGATHVIAISMLGENHYAVEITERARGRRTKVFRQSATTTVRGGHGLITFITYGRTVPPIVDEAALIKDAKPAPPDATEQRTLCARPVFSGANLREPPPAQRMLNLPAAWHFSRGAGQKVAIIDTGVTRHPRLPNLQPGGDHVSNSDGTSDCDSHGTLVAGIVAAQPSTDDAFSGVAPDATILSIRQLSLAYERKDEPGATTTTGYGSVRTLAPAVVRAVNLGATVINIAEVACAPGGTDLSDAALGAAVKYAYDRNVVVVAAAGNVESGSNCRTQNHNPDVSVPGWSTVQTVVSPDWFVPYVLSVASVAPDGSPSHFSLNGPWVGVAAPGEGIVSLDSTPGGRGLVNREQTYNGVSPINGTSFASAYVAGLAALVRSRFPTLTAREVIDRITRTTHATGSGRDERVGSGLIDPLAALTTQLPNRPVDAGANGVQTPAPPVGSQTPAPPVGSQNPLPRWVAIIGVLTCLVVLLIAIARTWVGIRRRWLPPRTPSRFVGGWPRRTRSGSNPTSPYR